MQVVLIGAIHRKGISGKTGSPYDFAVLMVLRPVSTRSSGKMEVTGCGFEQAEIRTSLEVVKSVEKLGTKFPFQAVLSISNEMGEFGQLQAVASAVAVDRPAAVGAARVA
jgi:hypothetical protein